MVRIRSILHLNLLMFVAALFAQGSAHAAESEGFNVSWTAPTGCPTLADVQASIRRLLGSELGPHANVNVVVHAQASLQEDGRWLGVVETQSASNMGKRSLFAESCAAIAGATALIVALMIDPDAVAAHRAEAAQSTEPTPSAPEPESKPAPPPSTRPAPSVQPHSEESVPLRTTQPSRIKIFFGPLVAANAGTLPSVTLGAGVNVGALFHYGSIEVGGFDWTHSSKAVAATPPGMSGDFRLLSAFATACPSLRSGHFDLGLCADLNLNWVRGKGLGVTSGYGNSFTWLSAGGGGLVRLRLGQRVSIPLRLGALLPLAHPTFVFSHGTQSPIEVYRPNNVATMAFLGLDWNL